MSSIADLELITGVGANKQTITFFEGFESRAAGGPRKPAAAAGQAALGGPGDKTQVLYSVRWVQAPKDKAAASAPGRPAAGRAGEVKKMNMTMQMPSDGLGNCAVPVRMSGAYGV
mmetsp:Transcript_109569/g.304816  ORF Transcript_109569/g.304816 Transcript_109569/m.304816 type:complete len:115 (-) Transcript_109569:133-477(-)